MPRPLPALAIAALLLPALTGCAGGSGGGADWPAYPTAQERHDHAPQVVIATVRRTDRTVETQGVYRVYRATTERVVKGDAPRGAFDLIATSDRCWQSGKPVEYVDGDPLAAQGRFVLYLSAEVEHGVHALVVPGAADPLPSGAPLPFRSGSPGTAAPSTP